MRTFAESELKRAGEIFSKLSNRRQEARVLLDQSELKYQRESYDDALKLASKALACADELKAIDLQVRGHILKGNIFRFLKGGNIDKAKDHLARSLRLAQAINDVHLLFDIYYS